MPVTLELLPSAGIAVTVPPRMVPKGFSAAVYTQTTDVEGEVNGLMTYDRKVIKINEAEVRKANQEVIKALSE